MHFQVNDILEKLALSKRISSSEIPKVQPTTTLLWWEGGPDETKAKLTKAQKARIEKNRKKALAKLAGKRRFSTLCSISPFITCCKNTDKEKNETASTEESSK